jgi:methyl-accepting chemotaxis protein
MLGIWNTSRVVRKPIVTLSGFAEKLAEGDMDFTIKVGSTNEMGQLAVSFQKVQDAVCRMLADVNRFAGNIEAGNLAERVEMSRYPGDYRKIMSGLNRILDTIAGSSGKSASRPKTSPPPRCS